MSVDYRYGVFFFECFESDWTVEGKERVILWYCDTTVLVLAFAILLSILALRRAYAVGIRLPCH